MQQKFQFQIQFCKLFQVKMKQKNSHLLIAHNNMEMNIREHIAST